MDAPAASSRRDLGPSDDDLRRLHEAITRRGEIAGLYVVTGEDDFRRERLARNLAAWIVPEQDRELNLTQLDGAEHDAAAIAAHLETGTLSFLASQRRVILVRRATVFDKPKQAQPLLDRITAGLASNVTLILEAPGSPDRRTKAYKTMAEHGVILHFPEVTDEAKLRSFLVRQMRAAQIKATDEALELMLELCGPNSRQLALETQKLAAFVGPRGLATAEAVRLVVSPSREAIVFELTDAIGQGDVSAALTALRHLLAQRHAPIVLLVLLSNRTRLWLQARALIDAKRLPSAVVRAANYGQFRNAWEPAAKSLRDTLPEDKAANLCAQHPYTAFTIFRDVRAMSQSSLAWALSRCLHTDEALKSTTGLSDEAHLELLTMDLCRVAAP